LCNPDLGKPLPLYAAEAVSANLPWPRLLPRLSELPPSPVFWPILPLG